MNIEHGKIGKRQFSMLVILFTIGTSMLVAPGSITKDSEQDAWIAALLGAALGMLYVLLFCTIGRRYPNMTFTEYSEVILGKWLGKIASTLYFFFFFHLCLILLREMGEFITTELMPETPIQAIEIMFMSIVIIAVRLGLETIARAAEVFFPWVIFLFILLILFLIPQADYQKVEPVFEHGILTLFRSSLLFQTTPFSQLVIFLMIFPYISQPNGKKRDFLMATFIGGLLIVIIILLCVAVLGVDLTLNSSYPSYVVAKKINIGNFLQRMEAVVAAIWFITIFFKLTICFYASTLSFAQILKLTEYRFLTTPLGLIAVVLSIVISPDAVYMKNFISRPGIPWGLTFGLVLPLGIWMVAAIRGKREQGGTQQ